MKKPEMILFDYGETLIYEPNFSPESGNAAIFPYISENPYNVTLEEFSNFLLSTFDDMRKITNLMEIHEHTFLRYVLDYYKLKLSVSIEEAEWIMWNAISPGAMTPDADKMLAELRRRGIRTGIISNLCWSGDALKRRLRQFFPDHEFEFVITSSEYIFRKPDRHIFDMAAMKSGLPKKSIWFCGNDIEVDIFGAHNAGLFPVLYADKRVPSRLSINRSTESIDFPHLVIDNWMELIALLDKNDSI